jgi:hypothetical protein
MAGRETMILRYDILALCILAVCALWLIYRRDRAGKKAVRGSYFDDCRTLFGECRVEQTGLEFPILDGVYEGHRVRLEPVIDHMAVRKLPSLWLKVTVLGALPIGGTIDFLARPQNTEFYSPSERLPLTLRIPAGWPQHALLRTDIEDRSVPVDFLTPHMRIFDDAKTKELVVTPRGVRIVYQAAQGERAYYMVLRQPEFGAARLSVTLARRLLEEAIAVYNSAATLPNHGTREPPPGVEQGGRDLRRHGTAERNARAD